MPLHAVDRQAQLGRDHGVGSPLSEAFQHDVLMGRRAPVKTPPAIALTLLHIPIITGFAPVSLLALIYRNRALIRGSGIQPDPVLSVESPDLLFEVRL
jgi:hypothetical protein